MEHFIYESSFNVPIYLLGDMNCRLESSDNPETKAFFLISTAAPTISHNSVPNQHQ